MIDLWENQGRADRCSTTDRPLTRSLDLTEEGLAMQATRHCSVAECDRPHRGRGYCNMHLQRVQRHGTADREAFQPKTCAIAECDRPVLARDWCGLHYGRWDRNGDPLIVRPNPAMLPGERNCKWQGDEISYSTAHDRVRAARGSASGQPCADCAGAADGWSYDHTDPDERIQPDDPKRMPYSVKVEHYQPRCHSCHWRVDHPSGTPTRA